MHELVTLTQSDAEQFAYHFSPLHYARLFDHKSSLPVIYEDPFRFFFGTTTCFYGELSYQPIGFLVYLLLRKDFPALDSYPEPLVKELANIALTDSISVPLNHLLDRSYWHYFAPTGHTMDAPLLTLESLLSDAFEKFEEVDVYEKYIDAVELLTKTWDKVGLSRLELVFYSYEDHERQDEGRNEQYSTYLTKIEEQTADMGRTKDVFYLHYDVKIRGGGFSCYLQ